MNEKTLNWLNLVKLMNGNVYNFYNNMEHTTIRILSIYIYSLYKNEDICLKIWVYTVRQSGLKLNFK